jgi:hypothetical protein
VELITSDKAFISGRILAVNPGPVVTMFVGEELATSATIPVDSVYTVDLSLVSNYAIGFIDNWFTNELFNGPSLVWASAYLLAALTKATSSLRTLYPYGGRAWWDRWCRTA